MHYKNGREAKNGDKVMIVNGYYAGVTGILYNAVAGNDYCNGQLAPMAGGTPNLKECLHVEDVLAAAATVGEPEATESPAAPPTVEAGGAA